MELRWRWSHEDRGHRAKMCGPRKSPKASVTKARLLATSAPQRPGTVTPLLLLHCMGSPQTWPRRHRRGHDGITATVTIAGSRAQAHLLGIGRDGTGHQALQVAAEACTLHGDDGLLREHRPTGVQELGWPLRGPQATLRTPRLGLTSRGAPGVGCIPVSRSPTPGSAE